MENWLKKMADDLAIRGRTPVTERSYRFRVRAFLAYTKCDPETITSEQVRDYLVYFVRERGSKPSSLNSITSTLRFFFRVTVRRPEVMARFPCPRIDYPEPDILSGSEVTSLLENAPTLRDRTLFMLMYGEGLRVREACSLKVGDVDSKRMVLHIPAA